MPNKRIQKKHLNAKTQLKLLELREKRSRVQGDRDFQSFASVGSARLDQARLLEREQNGIHAPPGLLTTLRKLVDQLDNYQLADRCICDELSSDTLCTFCITTAVLKEGNRWIAMLRRASSRCTCEALSIHPY